MNNANMIRDAILHAVPPHTSTSQVSTNPGQIYVPRAHAKALRHESSLIVGSRGVGKSFWTMTLNSPDLRSHLFPSIEELRDATVGIGFSEKPDIDAYPDRDTISSLLKRQHEPYEIWRAVVLRWVSKIAGIEVPRSNWESTIEWVCSNPEGMATCVQNADGILKNNRQKGLLLFDALDRSSTDWDTMDLIVKDLLRVILWLGSHPSLRGKVFLREDQFERNTTNFPDASKLLATKTDLTWQPHDLHGLLWQFLLNAPEPHGDTLRNTYRDTLDRFPKQQDGIWKLDESAKQEGAEQRKLFDHLAGPWMGRDKRRGIPYVWIISHLADGKGQTSPRSFLEAIRTAVEDSKDRYNGHPYAMHYESIKRGVQEASQIRIDEIAEDFPWVRDLLKPLEGMNVPCDFTEIKKVWGIRFPNIRLPKSSRLPPQHMESGWDGILQDLKRLGILEIKRDGRINMPDLFRVGFGLGRKGGVRPAKPR